MEPIDLRMAAIREARNAERRFCFEVITPNYKRVYQAPTEEEMHNWINAVNNALQSAVEGRSNPQPHSPPSSNERSAHRDIGSVLTGKSSSLGHHHHSPSNAAANNVYRRTTVGARPSYTRTDSNSFDENPSKLLQIIKDNDQGNRWCADCSSSNKVEWTSINLGIVLCIECSGIHRSLGTHISKIRSLTLDVTSFSTDIVELILLIGNRVSNMVWEATLEPALKPSAQSTREQRLKFGTAKYVDKAYVSPINSSLSHYSTPDEMLLASVKKNEVQGVLYALALGANPNAADRSRNTHAVFLALAAADPASPGGLSATNASPSTRAAVSSSHSVPAFPVAELLVQNGAVIPSTLPAFPLSHSAKQYIEQRSQKDILGDLPIIKGGSSAANPFERENSGKLQKRINGVTGGRLTSKP